MSISLKKMSDLSDLLTSLFIKEEMSYCYFFFLNLKKHLQSLKKNFYSNFMSELLVFCERKSEWVIHSKKMSDLLCYHEWPERIAHGHSFVMSDLSKLLIVAH